MVEAVFAVAARFGLNVLRTWAFLDCGAAAPGSIPPGSQQGVFFHYWNSQTSRPDFNGGPDGLEHLDRVIALAEDCGIRLILTFANNWSDFGGVKQYLSWFGLRGGHHRFLRNLDVKQAYREYVEHLLTRVNSRTGRRYVDEPSILAWELMNEPRCVDDKGQAVREGLDTLTDWIEEMSAFVRRLDPNHLICAGDEGYFFRRSHTGPKQLYNGCYGVDCERILGLPDIDFGTFHLYPKMSPKQDPIEFGKRWIREHIEAGRRADKPMLLEEFGFPVEGGNELAYQRRRNGVFEDWLREVQENDGAGAIFWMLASTLDDSGQLYPDYDGCTVYSPEQVPSVLAFSRGV